MAGITQTIPSFIGGISEQPDNLKFSGQVKDVTNAVPDITRGLFKRPGADRIGTSPLSNVQAGGSWFHYYRDTVEGAYIGQIAANGQIKIWSCNTGVEQTTAYGAPNIVTNTGGQVDTTYYAGDLVQANSKIYEATLTISSGAAPSHSSGTTNGWKFIQTVAAAASTIQSYLSTSAPENLQCLTINDTTFVNNRDTSNANTLIGTTGTTDSAPHRNYAFVELLRSANGRQYGLNIKKSTSTVQTTLTRATRIAITSDTLDESDGTGHCPGIGTQVFSVTAASSYTDPAIVSANQPKRSTGLVPSNQIGFGNTGHIIHYGDLVGTGLATGTAVVYTATDTNQQIPNLTSGTTYFITSYAQTDGNTTTYFRLAATATDAANGTYISISNPASGSTHTFTEAVGTAYTSGKTNLIFRINALGQQGVSPNYNANSSGPGGQNYRCSYQREVVLLHGGEGWITGDTVTVTLTSASVNYNYTIRVEEHESTVVNATVTNNHDGLIRPAPTPFDSDTAVTSDTILGGIRDALPNEINADVIGTGIYLYTDDASDPANDIKFSVEIVEDDLMRVMHTSVNDVTNLPNQCKHGYIVQISNSRMADEDDYYLVFNGAHNRDGSGSWSECADQGITKSLTNMPLVIQRTAYNSSTKIAEFTVKQFEYEGRRVGDDKTNPFPSFTGGRINKIVFFRNRLAFLSGENVILSRPGTLGRPDFFIESALTVSASDPIDISAASMFPSELFDGIETTSGLLVFSTNQQFLLAADDTVLNPDTAKMRSVSTFNYNKDIPPISLGTTVGYVDNSGKFSRFNEMANIRREGEPNVVEVSKVVPSLLPKNIDLLTNSRENGIILMSQTDTTNSTGTVYGYRYFQVAEQRQLASWFKWKFNKGLLYHFIIDDEYFFLDKDKFLQKIRLVKSDEDPTATDENEINYLLHLDNHTTINGGVFSNTSNTTTFSNVVWLNDIQNSNYNVAIIDSTGRYGIPTISGTTLTLVGDWRDSTLPNFGQTGGDTHFTVGYLYNYEVQFPTIYPTQTSGNRSTADVNSSLVLHRLKFHFGKVGTYKTSLKRVGKPTYEDQHESILASEYEAGKVPYLPENIKTVPVYDRNTNVDIILKSTHPSPATLHALSWEGDYSPKFYRRV